MPYRQAYCLFYSWVSVSLLYPLGVLYWHMSKAIGCFPFYFKLLNSETINFGYSWKYMFFNFIIWRVYSGDFSSFVVCDLNNWNGINYIWEEIIYLSDFLNYLYYTHRSCLTLSHGMAKGISFPVNRIFVWSPGKVLL